MAETLQDISNRVSRVERLMTGVRGQLSELIGQKVYPFITRTEFRELNQRISSGVALIGTELEALKQTVENNELLQLTQQEAQALKAGAFKVAAVEADFRAVITEMITKLDDFERTLFGSGRTLESRISTLESKFEAVLSATEALQANYGTILATVNMLKRNLSYSQGILVVDTSTGLKTITIPNFHLSQGYVISATLEYGGNAGARVKVVPQDEVAQIRIVDNAEAPVNCAVTNERVHWMARKDVF